MYMEPEAIDEVIHILEAVKDKKPAAMAVTISTAEGGLALQHNVGSSPENLIDALVANIAHVVEVQSLDHEEVIYAVLIKLREELENL